MHVQFSRNFEFSQGGGYICASSFGYQGSAFRERCGPKDDAQRKICNFAGKEAKLALCGKSGAPHVALVLNMHRAKFGLNRADSI